MSDRISIGILTYNAGKDFQKTLDAIAKQHCSMAWNLVVLDSESSDQTRELAQAVGAEVHSQKLVEFSFGSARDRLFSLCNGDILVTISQDAVPADENWLEQLCRPIADGSADIVQGLEKPSENDFFWLKNHFFYAGREWRSFIEKNGKIGLSCVNLALKRNTWESLKFSPINMCEDKLLQKRAFDAGTKVVRADQAVVIHGHQYNVVGLIKRSANEGMALRRLGERYTLVDLLCDLLRPYVYKLTIIGLCKGEVHRLSELLFPVIRPTALWFGAAFRKEYWR